MFNIKKKIYVAHENELVELMQERCIILHPRHESLYEIPDATDDKTQRGVVGSWPNYDAMLTMKFESNVKNFFDFLETEEDLMIVVTELDYARLYAEVLMELKQDYGIIDANIDKMLEHQRLKDFFQGPSVLRAFCYASEATPSAFEQKFRKVADSYVPTAKLYRNISELPFEVIYAMYKWGNISRVQANVKIAAIAEALFKGQIENVIEQGKVAVASDPTILQEYTGDNTISSIDEIIRTIFGDGFLQKVFCYTAPGEELDLSDGTNLTDIKNLCAIIIAKDLDFDSQPAVDQQEFDFFADLYEQQDIDVIDNAKFNFISTGTVATKQQKFNASLIMSE